MTFQEANTCTFSDTHTISMYCFHDSLSGYEKILLRILLFGECDSNMLSWINWKFENYGVGSQL